MKRFVNWYIDNRQIENGEFGGGLSDDGDLTNWWPGTAFMGADPEKIRRRCGASWTRSTRRACSPTGCPTIQTDELHSYEEGIQVLGQALLLDYGSPKQLERAMETAAAIERITGINAAGHRHIRSSYFSGTKIAEEGVWGWSKPSSYLVLHPAIALVEFNGVAARAEVAARTGGRPARASQAGRGRRATRCARPSSSRPTRTCRRGHRRRDRARLPLLWAAYRWTGDRKYLQPFLDAGAAQPARRSPPTPST